MGPVYTRTHDGRPLRREVTAAERAALFELYDRHHGRLTRAVRAALEANGWCLIVDAHSFPSRPLPYEEQSAPAGNARWKHRPAICLGSDTPGSLPARRSHTPAWLRAAAYDAFAARFASVAFDRPFAGSIVPLEFLGSDARVATIMVEVRRDQYMDEATGERLPAFEQVASDLRAAVGELAAAAALAPAPRPQTDPEPTL